jgi:hypothetical protein
MHSWLDHQLTIIHILSKKVDNDWTLIGAEVQGVIDPCIPGSLLSKTAR